MTPSFSISGNLAAKTDKTTQTLSTKAVEKQTENTNKEVAEIVQTPENNDFLKTELTLDNFKASIEKETGRSLQEILQENKSSTASLIKQPFKTILKKMDDKTKSAKINDILKDFSSCPDLIRMFFESFEDKKLRQQCADSITYETFKDLDTKVQSELVKFRSIPGTEKLSEENEKKAEEIYKKYPDIIEELFRKGISEEERNKKINELPEGDKKTAVLEYCKCLKIRIVIVKDVLTNPEKKDKAEEIIYGINQNAKKIPGYENYLEGMADIISSIPDGEFNVDKNKIIEMLEKSSNNRFSKILEDKTREKSAVDKDGKFKTAPEEIIKKSEEKIQEIKQAIEEASNPQKSGSESTQKRQITEKYSAKKEEDSKELSETEANSIETIKFREAIKNGDFKALKDVFTGKKNVSKYVKQDAIKQFKIQDEASQKLLMLKAVGDFYDDLLSNLKTSRLQAFIERGYAKNYDAKQKMEKELDERNNVA